MSTRVHKNLISSLAFAYKYYSTITLKVTRKSIGNFSMIHFYINGGIYVAQLKQIIKAGFIRSKTMLELNQRFRIIFFHTKILHIVAG
jgi:hypothetical protein